ncbi:MAG: flagellar filament capping protein FliD, partial [Azovibrio sp.]
LDKFATYKAAFADEAMGSATASTGATAGSYSMVVDKLAQSQRLNFQPSGPIDTGTLTLKLGTVSGGSFTADPDRTVDINVTDGSLTGLRDAINRADTGVTATIVHGKDGDQLVLSGKEGGDQAFSLEGISGFEFDPAAATNAGFTQTQVAQNAELTLNGIAISSNSNTVTDVLDGVTLSLKKTGSTTLNVTVDSSTKLKSSLEDFVKAYNDTAASIKSLGAYNPDTKEAGALQGNSLLRSVEGELRKLIFDTADETSGQKLSDIGISFAADGTLKLDTEKLDAVIAANPEAVANLTATVGSAFNKSIEQVVGISGSIKTSTDSMNTMIRDLDKRQETLQLRLTQIEDRYRRQFGALDTLMANMSKTSSFLSQQLSSLIQ